MKTKTLLVAVALLALASGLARGQTLGEALDAPQLTWTTDGAIGGAPWFYQTTTTHDGVDAAECGGLTNAWSESWLQTTVTGRVAVLFWWKSVSPGGSSFGFWFQTNDTYLEGLYGNVDWRPAMVSFAEGTNSLKWSSLLGGLNPTAPIATNWLDQVVVTNIAGLKPTFLTQPEPVVTMPENYSNETNLHVQAIGDIPMTYQWQRNGTNLTEGWPYYGVETPSCRFYPRTAAEAGDYRVVLSNVWGLATSAVCTVSVVPAKPGFHPFQPADVVLAPGAFHSFNYISILGTSPFTLQWLKDGNSIPNGNIGPATFADAGGYSLVATNAYGAATSRVAQVMVSTDLPTIVSEPNPGSTEAQPGDSVQFSMQASGPEPLSFSWRKVGEGTEIATMNWFGFDSVDPTNTGFYYAILSNNNGAVTSRVCVLAVSPVTALGLALDVPQLTVTNHYDGFKWTPDGNSTNAHDGLCAARSPELYFGSSAFSTAVTGPTNVSFWWRISAIPEAHLDLSVDGSVSRSISGETAWARQSLALSAGEHTLTWTFRKDAAGSAGADAAWVDQFAFSGTNSSGVTTNEITAFTANGDVPHWYLQTTNTHAGADAWQSGAITDSETNRLTAHITGPGTLTFWWQVESEEDYDFLEFWLDGAPQISISGQTNWHQLTYVLGAGSHTLEWLYDKDGSTSEGADAGWVDEVIFTPATLPPTLEQALNVTNLTFTTGGDAPWWIETNNTHDGIMALQSGAIGNNQASWLSTTISGPGQLTYWYAISTENNSDWLALPQGGITSGGAPSIWNQETLNLPTGTHTLEWRYFKDGSGSGGSDAVWLDEVTWTPLIGTAPAIVTQPTNVVAVVGQPVSLVVAATGTEPLNYQWYRNSSPISGATDSGYLIASASSAHAGSYWAHVFNDFGTTNTGTITLAVYPVLQFTTAPTNRLVSPGSTVTFQAAASGTAPFQWQWSLNNQPLLNATNALLTVTNVQLDQLGTYRVNVQDVSGQLKTALANLAFIPPPVIDYQPVSRLVYTGAVVVLYVGARNELPMNYQWFKNNSPIAGANAANLILANITAAAIGSYSATVSNQAGFAASDPATIAIKPRFPGVTPGSLDPFWQTGAGPDVPIYAFNAAVLQPDGKLIVGGQFQSLHGIMRPQLARLNADGTVDSSFRPNYLILPERMLLQPDGKLIVAGWLGNTFTAVNRGVVRFLSDGTRDETFPIVVLDRGTYNYSDVLSMARQSDGKIVISGYFAGVASNAYPRLMRLNTDGTPDTGYKPGLQINSDVMTISLQSDDKLVIGGYFSSVEGQSRRGIARLLTTGGLDTAFNPGTGFPTRYTFITAPNTIACQSDGDILVGGDFPSYNGVNATNLIRLNSNGSLDTGFTAPILDKAFPEVRHIVSISPSETVIAGDFTNLAGLTRYGIAKLGASGAVDPTFNFNQPLIVGYDGNGNWQRGDAFPVVGSTNFFAVGWPVSFHMVGTNASPNTARFSLTTAALDTNWYAGLGADLGHVNAAARQPDGPLLVAGAFRTLSGKPARYLARLLPDATVDSTFRTGTGTDQPVERLELLPDGRILISGQFTNYNGLACPGLVQLNSDGSRDTTFQAGNELTNFWGRTSLNRLSDGRIWFGAGRREFNLASGRQVLRLLATGAVDPTFNGVAELGQNPVDALVPTPDGGVIVATSYGAPGNRVQKLQANGERDRSFSADLGQNSTLPNEAACMVVQPDGKILVGLVQSYRAGLLPVMRLLPNGSQDPGFSPAWTDGLVGPGTCTSILLQADGRILLGGMIPTTFNNTSVDHTVLRLEANGAFDRTYATALNHNQCNNPWVCTVNSLVPTFAGAVIIGGGFNHINGVGRSGLARLTGEEFCVDLGGSVQLLGPTVEGGNWRFEVQAVSGVRYHLESAPNLNPYTLWQSRTNVAGFNGTLLMTVPVSGSEQQFWRLRVQCE